MRMEPPPSPPVAMGTTPPATTAALPPDEPPGVRPVCHGLCETPWSFVRPMLSPPNSLAVAWHTGLAPPMSTRRSTMVAV
jgi:hypothetical protein